MIRDHLQDPDASTTWCGRGLDFTNATFDGGSFTGAKFTGGEVSFYSAEFTGGKVPFVETKFTGGEISFRDAKFTGSTVPFYVAEFTGGEVLFDGAEFTGGEVLFDGAEFTGGEVTFFGSEFTGSSISWGPFEPRQNGLHYKRGSGDRTNRPRNLAVRPLFSVRRGNRAFARGAARAYAAVKAPSATPVDAHLTGQVSLSRPCGEGDNWPCGTKPICHPGGLFDELFQTGRSNGRSRRRAG